MAISPEIAMELGRIGAVAALSLGAVGSALGTGTAGAAAIGAWKRCYAQSKLAPFVLLTFVGAPLSQTIYGMIVMLTMNGLLAAEGTSPMAGVGMLGMGVFGGLAMGFSAWYQGRAAAGACVALVDTGKGFTNYLAVLGIVETVAIFVMVFILISLGQ